MTRWEQATCPPTWRRTESYRSFHVSSRCVVPVSTLKVFLYTTLMFLPAPHRRVQQSDHSSQTRRGEHRLRQCLFHWCECKSTWMSGSFHFINASNRWGVLSLPLSLLPFIFVSFYSSLLSLWTSLPVISSIWLQGYRQKDSYMASQGPLQHTIEDFWRMIWEWRSCSIVMLTELEERGQVCGCVQIQTVVLDIRSITG